VCPVALLLRTASGSTEQQHSTGSQPAPSTQPPLATLLLLHSPGECGTKKLWGSDFFTYVSTQSPEEAAVFDKSMVSLTYNATGPAVAGHDWGRYTKVVDVGGGFGTLIGPLLRANPGVCVGGGGGEGEQGQD
jgi:hypothetical protein